MTVATSDSLRFARRAVVGSLRLWLMIILGSTSFAPSVSGQIPGISLKGKDTAPAAETPDEADARLQLWLKEARAVFARINAADSEQALPEGIDSAALLDYRRDLEQIISGINRYRKIVESQPAEGKALAAAREVDSTWRGFNEKPPYSILMLDELVNQQDAIRGKDASYRSSLVLFNRTLSGIMDEARDAGQASRRALSAATEGPAGDDAASWRLDADRAKSRLLAVRAQFLRSNIALLKDQAETTQLQLSLLDRQITIARKKAAFSTDDLETVTKAAADRQAALRKELAAIRKREQEANVVKNRMQGIKDQLLSSTPEGKPLEETPDLALVTVKMEASETRVDSLQFVAGILELLAELEADGVESYRIRRSILEAKTSDSRAAAVQSLRSSYDRMTARGIVLANELAAVNADIVQQESRASARPADDPRLLPLSDVRASLWDKQAVIQRAVQAATSKGRMVKRWLDDYDSALENRSISVRFSEGFTSAWTKFRGVWSVEVFTYNDTVMAGGIPMSRERGVTLGKFVTGIFFFIVAYFIANRIKNRLRNTVVRRGHIADAQAKTLSNWLMIVVGLALVVATLHFLKIPITVFAFFGGALAIGLGFGTQTLIKNFISGIIVLFERKIRVGDIVDIGGVSGTITEINTRSSVLRGGDGKETLVPNSLFLENRVTNLTLSNRRVRRLLTIRVLTEAPVQTVHTILRECIERHGLILKEPPPYVTLEDIVENANIFGLYYWTEFNDKTNADVVASDLRFMAEKRIGEIIPQVLKAGETATKAADVNAAADAPEELKSTPHDE